MTLSLRKLSIMNAPDQHMGICLDRTSQGRKDVLCDSTTSPNLLSLIHHKLSTERKLAIGHLGNHRQRWNHTCLNEDADCLSNQLPALVSYFQSIKRHVSNLVMICLKFFLRLLLPRGEIMINRNEKFTVEKCPKNEKEIDVYMADENGFDVLVHCGNHKIEKVHRY